MSCASWFGLNKTISHTALFSKSKHDAYVQAAGLVDRILRERADDIIDMDKAVKRVEAERHHQLPSAAQEVPSLTPALTIVYTFAR